MQELETKQTGPSQPGNQPAGHQGQPDVRSSPSFRTRGRNESNADNSGLEEIVIKIRRCCKVVKGGKRFSFAALVAVGDRNGKVGYGKGNANEVRFAVEKATKDAKKHLTSVPMKDTTFPHRVWGKYGATSVIIRPACRGTGIIAGSSVRAILELAGIKDILAKIIGSTNPTNVVKATLNALSTLKTYRERRLLLSTTANSYNTDDKGAEKS